MKDYCEELVVDSVNDADFQQQFGLLAARS